MIPNEVVLGVLLLIIVGMGAGIMVAMVMSAYLRWKIPGGKWALLNIVWSLGLAYALPILYVWTIDTSYVQELVTDYPALFTGVPVPIVAMSLAAWLGVELEKRRTRDKGNSDE